MDIMRLTWVWADEVTDLLRRRMRAEGISGGELARRAEERFGVNARSFERQMRAAQSADGVMSMHTADRLLVLVGCHLTDLPCYRAALSGELTARDWPTRGRRRVVAAAA